MCTFERALGEQDAVVGENTDRYTGQMGKARDQCRAVERLEFVELRRIDQAGDQLADVVLRARVGRYNAVKLCRIVAWVARRDERDVDRPPGVQVCHDA